MKYLLFLFFISQAYGASPIGKLSCSKEIQSLMKEWKALDQWEKQYQLGLEKSFYASPTETIGEWVVARPVPQGTAVGKVSDAARVEVLFPATDCKAQTKVYPQSAPAEKYVSDKEIRKFITENNKGAIYVWSPRMIFSQKGIPNIKDAAKKLKLPLLVLLDKEVSEKEVSELKKSVGEENIRQVDSLEFRMRNVGQHFPALMVFKDSRIVNEVKYGFEKSDSYQSDLVRMLGHR